jgi:hypothetical protein
MQIKDQSNEMASKILIPDASYDADNTPVAVDISGFGSAVINIGVGVGGITFTSSNKVEFKLTHSDDDDTYAAVETADLVGITVASLGIVYSLVAAHSTPTITEVPYIGGKRYLKLLADFDGTHGSPTPMHATVICGKPQTGPVA